MHTKLTLLALGGVALLIAGAWYSTGRQDSPSVAPARVEQALGDARAVMEHGVQYVDITARGGYTPRVTKAQAGVPTVIRMTTENTFDCSLALVIRDLGYQEFLPQSGVTEIEVPADKAQGTLRGMCSMAMYHFEIVFE